MSSWRTADGLASTARSPPPAADGREKLVPAGHKPNLSARSPLVLTNCAMAHYKFSGWAAMGKDSVEGKLERFDYEPKAWDEEDVDIKIQYCGVCASDIHNMSSGWREMVYPQVVGHEIVGVAVRVGAKVSHVKVGDIVGVGPQSDSCRTCDPCVASKEPYCDNGYTPTYNGVYKRGAGKGDKSYGGYADYHRAPGHFVIKIPDGLDPAIAAPMLCAGGTMYSPLKQFGCGTTAMDVGIIGIGGLGHFGLLFAKAMGARSVVAISHSESKQADAEQMGASKFIATHGDDEVFKAHRRTLDLIISTTNDDAMPLAQYVSLLRPGGQLVICGAPEKPFDGVSPFMFLSSNVSIGGSFIASPSTIRDMFEVALKADVKPWIEKRDMDEVNQVVVDMHASKARYRYVLVNTNNGGKL